MTGIPKRFPAGLENRGQFFRVAAAPKTPPLKNRRRCSMPRFLRALLVLVLAFTVGSILRAVLPTVQTGHWVSSGALAQARSGAAAVLLPDGRVMITGGDVNGSPSSSVEIFNTDGSISSAAQMS